MLLDHLWEKPPFSSFESYLYGYYLGDGTCSHWKGKPTTMYWIVYNPDDYQNLYRMQEGLGCKNLIVPDKKGLRLIISARKATDRMVERGLLWTGKGWRHPELDLKMLRCFDAMALFRGLVDSDGWLQKQSNGRNQLCFCSSWEKLVDSVRELMSTSYGVVGHKYTDTSRESAFGDQFIHRVSYSYDECCRLVKLGLYKNIGVGLERKRFIPLPGDLENDEWL